jgi:L-threonylcarbamoyladenylate synthase
VGLRVPDHAIAQALLKAFESIGGKGIAAPSANRFGHVSPTTAAAVIEELGDFLSNDDLVLDGGACAVGVESTIIDCTGDIPKILRPGSITETMIKISAGLAVDQSDDEKSIRVSGSLVSHYAPMASVILDQPPIAGQGFIAMAEVPDVKGVVRLAAPRTDEEFARVLYSALRAADEHGLTTVVVAQPSGDGIAIAIRDRLKRASKGR